MKKLFSGFLLLFLSGCSTIGNPKLMDDRLIEQIQVNQATQEQVKQWLGPPNTVSTTAMPNGTMSVWTYSYGHSSFLGATEGRGLSLSFGPDGKVANKSVSQMKTP